eukprot:1600886-Pyramimonas_sp.AAC.1
MIKWVRYAVRFSCDPPHLVPPPPPPRSSSVLPATPLADPQNCILLILLLLPTSPPLIPGFPLSVRGKQLATRPRGKQGT